MSQNKTMSVNAVGVIEDSATIFKRMLEEEKADQRMVETLRNRVYNSSNGGYLIATLKEPVRMPDGTTVSSALIRGDSTVELAATKQIGQEVIFTITLDSEGTPFVKSYM